MRFILDTKVRVDELEEFGKADEFANEALIYAD